MTASLAVLFAAVVILSIELCVAVDVKAPTAVYRCAIYAYFIAFLQQFVNKSLLTANIE